MQFLWLGKAAVDVIKNPFDWILPNQSVWLFSFLLLTLLIDFFNSIDRTSSIPSSLGLKSHHPCLEFSQQPAFNVFGELADVSPKAFHQERKRRQQDTCDSTEGFVSWSRLMYAVCCFRTLRPFSSLSCSTPRPTNTKWLRSNILKVSTVLLDRCMNAACKLQAFGWPALVKYIDVQRYMYVVEYFFVLFPFPIWKYIDSLPAAQGYCFWDASSPELCSVDWIWMDHPPSRSKKCALNSGHMYTSTSRQTIVVVRCQVSEFGTGDFRLGSRIGVWTQRGRMQQKPWRHFEMLI